MTSSQSVQGRDTHALLGNPDAGTNFGQNWPAPILWWAAAGGLFLVLEAYVWVRWFASGEAAPVATGADPVPAAVKIAAWVQQISLPIGALAVLVWLIRRCIQQRRLVLDAIILIGFASLLWQDPLCNYIRPLVFFNSYYVNLGGWVNGIPGWTSPNGQHTAEGLVSVASFYLSGSLLTVIAVCVLMRWATQRWPNAGPLRIIAVAYVAAVVNMIVMELVFVWLQVYAFAGVIGGLSLWAGTPHQFPIYEPFFVAAMLTIVAAMRHFRDVNGRMPYERGLDRLNISGLRKTAVRVLAVVGLINLVTLAVYIVPMNIIALHVSPYPGHYPSYLRNDVCGGNSGYDCPGNGNPIPLRDTPKTRTPVMP